MLISVITVCYNSEKTIRDTIDSMLKQTYSDVEYIVVDGLSTDNTVKIAEEYKQMFKEKGYSYRIISEKDNGIYDAMNKGIKSSTGEIIGIINSDDWYESDTLKIVAETYANEHFDMLYADLNNIQPDGSIKTKHCKDDIFPTSRHWNHPTTFVTKALYNELGAFKCKGGLYDDFDLYLRIRKAGKKRVILSKALANFRCGGISKAKSVKESYRLFKDRLYCYLDNGYCFLYVFECFVMELGRFLFLKG